MKITKIRLKEIIKEEFQKIVEGKRTKLTIPVKDKVKTDKILKKLRLKHMKDYDIGYGGRATFILDIDSKQLDKVLTFLMQQRVRVR